MSSSSVNYFLKLCNFSGKKFELQKFLSTSYFNFDNPAEIFSPHSVNFCWKSKTVCKNCSSFKKNFFPQDFFWTRRFQSWQSCRKIFYRSPQKLLLKVRTQLFFYKNVRKPFSLRIILQTRRIHFWRSCQNFFARFRYFLFKVRNCFWENISLKKIISPKIKFRLIGRSLKIPAENIKLPLREYIVKLNIFSKNNCFFRSSSGHLKSILTTLPKVFRHIPLTFTESQRLFVNL